jgi:diguanylate cyclase (GGDEF)-like protein/PAS domain S-box-containing protein
LHRVRIEIISAINLTPNTFQRGFEVTDHHSVRIAEECCHAVLEASGNAMMIVDKNGCISKVNDEFASLSGFKKEEVENNKIWSEFLVVNKGDSSNFLNGFRQMGSQPIVEIVFYDRDGRPRFGQVNVRTISKTGKFVVSFQDRTEIRNAEKEKERLDSELIRLNCELTREIAERKSIEKQIMRPDIRDQLTGLPNRDLLTERLKQAFAYADRHGSQIALMFLDLDDFKKANDKFGQFTCDILLKEVAKRLRNCTRQYDTIARIGSDKFVVFINDMKDIHDIVKFTEKVRGSFRQPFAILGNSFFMTSSIGVAIYPFHCTNSESLLKMAEIAMCQAKKEGKNTFRFFSSSMGSHADEPMRMEEMLRSALERGEFKAHYQPRINAASGMIAGMEALLRWQPPGASLAYPDEFLSGLEESGLIVPVGEWFLEKVCSQVKAWQDAGFPQFRVSVNLSAMQLRQENLPERVSEILTDTGLDSSCLRFELTEQIIMEDIGVNINILKKLKELGITISIGNFGTGCVSLRCLNMLPFDELRIDRSFIKGISSCSNDAKAVSASIALGRYLGKMLVAEGVESREQFDFLAHHQCEEMQGDFFGRPLPPEEFERWCVWSDRWGASIQ